MFLSIPDAQVTDFPFSDEHPCISCTERDAHYGLMRCYAHQGKRGLALRQYQHCADILLEELAVLPKPALQKFYQRLSGNE